VADRQTGPGFCAVTSGGYACTSCRPRPGTGFRVRLRVGPPVGSVIKKRRKRMAKKKHRKLLKKTRIQRRRQGK